MEQIDEWSMVRLLVLLFYCSSVVVNVPGLDDRAEADGERKHLIVEHVVDVHPNGVPRRLSIVQHYARIIVV